MGVAPFTRAIGRAAPTRRPPTVLNDAAGAVNEKLFVVSMLMPAVIWLSPDISETALLGATTGIAGCGPF